VIERFESEAGPSGRAGLYLHLPFCARVCPYCDFAVATGGPGRRRAYLDALLREARSWTGAQARFETVYLGGGTPSSHPPGDLERLLGGLRDALPIAGDAQVTLEANPEDVTAESARAWSALGVRTLSLGVQSLDDGALRFLGRGHDAAGARRAVAAARAADFHTLSLDLIFGLPGQDADGWRRELDEAVALEPDHLSCYQLTVHTRTRFGALRQIGRLHELGEDAQADLYVQTHELLAARGFRGYEVSNFARADRHRSTHNLGYWKQAPYLGLGCAAHSFDGGRRWWNLRRLGEYQAAVAAGRRPLAGLERLGVRERMLEALMLRLRTAEGLDLGDFAARFGADLARDRAAQLQSSVAAGLATIAGGRLALTPRGMAVADAIAASLA